MMTQYVVWLERGALLVVLGILWLRTRNTHIRLAKIEYAIMPGVKHSLRGGRG